MHRRRSRCGARRQRGSPHARERGDGGEHAHARHGALLLLGKGRGCMEQEADQVGVSASASEVLEMYPARALARPARAGPRGACSSHCHTTPRDRLFTARTWRMFCITNDGAATTRRDAPLVLERPRARERHDTAPATLDDRTCGQPGPTARPSSAAESSWESLRSRPSTIVSLARSAWIAASRAEATRP